MNCPFCGKKLIRGENREFENLSDHVFDPNMENHPIRPTFVCSCPKSNNAFWDTQGGFYTHGYIEGKTTAVGSWDEAQEKEFAFAAKIQPYMIFSKYKYDAAYNLARKLFKPFMPPFDAE
jgi:hypothetical protein